MTQADPVMSSALSEKLEAWFRAAAKAVHLPPYSFGVFEKKLRKHMMEVVVDKSYLYVDVHVSPRFWRKPPSEQRVYFAHELWHVIAHRADRAAEEACARLEEEVEGEVKRYGQQYEEEAEKLADHAATLILPLLPEWSPE